MRNHPNISERVLRELSSLTESAEQGETVEALRGYEGRAASLYFCALGESFKGAEGEIFRVNGRKRRPPPDPVNACLSMGYTLLAHECVAALRLARLEPSIGAYHVSRPGRPALALDLMEPFRPLIVDSVVLAAFNRNEFRPGHFRDTTAGFQLTEHGRKAFFESYGRRMATVVTHPVLEYRLSYRRMLALHARMVAAWLTRELRDLSFLRTR